MSDLNTKSGTQKSENGPEWELKGPAITVVDLFTQIRNLLPVPDEEKTSAVKLEKLFAEDIKVEVEEHA